MTIQCACVQKISPLDTVYKWRHHIKESHYSLRRQEKYIDALKNESKQLDLFEMGHTNLGIDE